MLFNALAGFLIPFLSWSVNQEPVTRNQNQQPLQFELRHLHATSRNADVVFSDVSTRTLKTLAMDGNATYTMHKTKRIQIFKPPSFISILNARKRSLEMGESEWLDWDEDEIEAPDIESRETLLTLAKMTNNAYLEPEDNQWYELDGNWTTSYPFGWEPDADGFRGHVFATPDNSTVIVSIKGTSASFIRGGGPTAKKDKLNDNLLFSCCCARIDWTWTTVCGCYKGGWKCDSECLEDALVDESLFFPIGTNLYNNLTYMYPDSNIWITGHSLGGALASLLGITFGAPVVAFESPGEQMASKRLHLPSPPSTHHITHVFNTADPIAMGTCTGVLSSCALAGYAMESRCHLGKRIIYDTISNLSWSVDIRNHGIVPVVDKILAEPWPHSTEEGREVPLAIPEEDDCVECYSWEYGDFSK